MHYCKLQSCPTGTGMMISNQPLALQLTSALTTQAWPYHFCQELTPFVAHDGGPCMCYQCFG